jgi:maltose O-acetyltransferase
MTLDEQMDFMLTGQMYNDLTPELIKARQDTVLLTDRYNESFGKAEVEREGILRELLGGLGSHVHFEPTFRCEFGRNIFLGNNFYANFDCVMLDGGRIEIGDDVLFGPRVSIYTSNHAFDPYERAAGGCYAKPVKIGSRVWVGGGVHITQGVTIGDNTIIGAGSVITRDIPAGVVAAGAPCRVLREITDADKTGFQV